MTFDDILKQGCDKMGLTLDEKQLNNIKTYTSMLLEWNEKINLTRVTAMEEIATKHFLDSFTPLVTEHIKKGATIIDVGTGAGFPGLPMAIMRWDLSVTLLDSLNKRIGFLQAVVDTLKLKNVTCVHSRAEDGGKNSSHREKYDIAISRAVANMASLSELCLPFVKVGGIFMALKGPMANEELIEAQKAIKTMGGEVLEIKNAEIPLSDLSHTIVIIKKICQTPTNFPRKAPLPTKNPIK